MATKQSKRSIKRNYHSRNNQYPIHTLDLEVLQPAWEWSPDPSHSLQRVRREKKDWVPLEENELEWEWDGIERRGSRKPNLDDYDHWPLDPVPLSCDKTGRNHFPEGWQNYERWLSERYGLS